MNHRILSLLLGALFAAALSAQMTNQPTSNLVVNGTDGAAPNHVWLTPPTTLTIEVGGNPQMPFLLAAAPALSIGEVVYAPTIAVDIGPFASLQVLMDGTGSPLVNPFNMFANTGASGSTTFSLTLPPGASIGTHTALQAFVIDFTLPGFVGCTAATEIGIGNPIGSISVLSDGPTGSGNAVFESTNGLDLANFGGPYYPETIALTNFGDLYPNENVSTIDRSPGSVFRFDPPTASAPRFIGGDTQSPLVRTTFGDLRIVRDGATQNYGFLITIGASSSVIPGTSFTTNAAGQCSWKKWIHVNGPVMAAVLDGHGIANDRVFLIRIDGIPFASNGQLIREITPTANVPSEIRAESLVMVSNVVYFAGRVPPSPNIASALYRCDMGGSVVATSLALPLIQNNPNIAPTRIVPEFRLAPDGLSFFYKSSNDTDTMARIHQVYQVTATTQSFRVVSFFSAPQPAIRDLGRVSDGTTNRFAVNSTVSRVAFVTFDPATGAEELYNGPITGGITSQVTTNARMDPAIDTIVEPHFADTTSIYFFAGQDAQSTDLYRFSTSTLAIANLTQTNGVTSATLPLPATPLSAIDPAGAFVTGGHFYFLRGGQIAAGSAIGQFATNLCGVVVSTSNVYDITGDEFDLSPNPASHVAPRAMEIYVDSAAGRLWFAGDLGGVLNPMLFTKALAATGPALQSAPAPWSPLAAPSFCMLAPDGSGDCAAVLKDADPLFSGRLVRATPGGAAATVIDESHGTQFRAKAPFPAGAGVAGFFFVDSISGTSADRVGFFDELSATYVILGGPTSLSNTQILGTAFP